MDTDTEGFKARLTHQKDRENENEFDLDAISLNSE